MRKLFEKNNCREACDKERRDESFEKDQHCKICGKDKKCSVHFYEEDVTGGVFYHYACSDCIKICGSHIREGIKNIYAECKKMVKGGK